jgi:hypothetical protein
LGSKLGSQVPRQTFCFQTEQLSASYYPHAWPCAWYLTLAPETSNCERRSLTRFSQAEVCSHLCLDLMPRTQLVEKEESEMMYSWSWLNMNIGIIKYASASFCLASCVLQPYIGVRGASDELLRQCYRYLSFYGCSRQKRKLWANNSVKKINERTQVEQMPESSKCTST